MPGPAPQGAVAKNVPDVTTHPQEQSCQVRTWGHLSPGSPKGLASRGHRVGAGTHALASLASVSTMFLSTWSAFFLQLLDELRQLLVRDAAGGERGGEPRWGGAGGQGRGPASTPQSPQAIPSPGLRVEAAQ